MFNKNDVLEILGKRDRKKWGHNTYFVKSGETIGLLYHNTIVVKFQDNGEVELNNGGWYSSTTKKRINQMLRDLGYVFSVKGDWFIKLKGEPRPIEYFNGMIVNRSGKCLNYWTRG